MKNAYVILLVSMFFAACSGGSSGAGTSQNGSTTSSNAPAKMNFKFQMYGKDINRDFMPSQGVVVVRKIIPKKESSLNIVCYEINLANFEIDPNKLSDAFPKKDGDARVTIQILGEQGAPESAAAIKPGEYIASQVADGENVYGKAWHVLFRYFDEGKIMENTLDAQYPKGTRKGSVKITSAAGDKVSGEIDLSDDKVSVKGTFYATIRKD